MKKRDIQIGATYAAKVSGKIVHVCIVCRSQYGGWAATNLATKRQIHIRSAARLRYKVHESIGEIDLRKDGVNYCRCCGGDVKSVGPLNARGACGDCVAEYSKPEYHRDNDQEPPDEEEGENE